MQCGGCAKTKLKSSVGNIVLSTCQAPEAVAEGTHAWRISIVSPPLRILLDTLFWCVWCQNANYSKVREGRSLAPETDGAGRIQGSDVSRAAYRTLSRT